MYAVPSVPRSYVQESTTNAECHNIEVAYPWPSSYYSCTFMLPNNSNRYARQLRQVVSYPGCLLAEKENMNEAGIQHRQFYASSLTILLCSKPSSKIVLVLSLTQHAAEEGGISLLPGHYTRGGRVGANCVDCEMVPVVTRAQYLHLNYVTGETEGGGERGRK